MAFTLEIESSVTEGEMIPLRLDGAWRVNRSLLRVLGLTVRGADTRIPGVAGMIPNPRRVDAQVVDLELLVQGFNDHEGDPHSPLTPAEGKILNLAWLQENLATPPASGTYRLAELTMPDATEASASVHIESWEIARDDGRVALVTFDLVVFDGVFVEGGS